MIPVSPKWLPALTTDHGLSTKINVLYGGQIIAEDIAFETGSVKVDRGSDVRRSLSLSIADPSNFPVAPTDTFAVYGQRLYVERGITYIDGTVERVPLGTFVITNVSGNIHTGPLSIAASGLEILLKRESWDFATSTKGFSSIAAFLAYHIEDTVPDASFVDRSTKGSRNLATKTWDAGSEKWAAMVEMASSIGAELFCDAAGTFVLADIPDPEDLSVAPVWDVTTGDSGVMVSANMTLSADGVYNRVIVTGENASDDAPPVSARAQITDTSNPLWYGGPFGKATKRFSSSLVTDSAQALATANALLRKYQGANRTVSLETIPNPALDAGDRIRVHYGDAYLPEIHVVHSFDIPLSVNDVSASSIATISGREDESE